MSPRKPVTWVEYECPVCLNTIKLNAALEMSASCGRCVGRKAKLMRRKSTAT